ncbi:DUF6216 family protein [Burkholderia ubonensis]|uniref:DUF6216 family protein n=1 Tax=Burkholderia ubonensis TaxID=101571 RepID=UPI000B11E66F|nr:DUF6216 family protein [Burkholderia ubonensis]
MTGSEIVSHATEMITVAVVITALAFTWIIFRNSSWHILKYRLWRIAYGKDQKIDKDLKTSIDNLSNLTSFRFHFFDAENWPHAQKIMKWAEDKEIDLGSVCACGRFFDFKKYSISRPPLKSNAMLAVYQIVLWLGILLLIWTIGLASTSRALVTFRGTDTWIVLGTSEATMLFDSNTKQLTKDDCTRSPKELTSTGFNDAEIASLCKFFEKKTASNFIASSVKAQRIILLTISAFSTLGLLCLRRSWMHVKSAWSLIEYLELREKTKRKNSTSPLNDKPQPFKQNCLLRFERGIRGRSSIL